MKTQNNLPPTPKTYDPPVYDVWEHYEKLRLHLQWFKENRSNLIRYIKCNELEREILTVRMYMRSMERRMQIEFIGDVLNLHIMQRENTSYSELHEAKTYEANTIELNPSEYTIRTY